MFLTITQATLRSSQPPPPPPKKTKGVHQDLLFNMDFHIEKVCGVVCIVVWFLTKHRLFLNGIPCHEIFIVIHVLPQFQKNPNNPNQKNKQQTESVKGNILTEKQRLSTRWH